MSKIVVAIVSVLVFGWTTLAQAAPDEPGAPRSSEPGSPRALPPPPPPMLPAVDPSSEPPPPSRPKVLPWITLAGSAIATAFGVSFALKTSDALNKSVTVSLPNTLALTSNQQVTLPTTLQQQQSEVFTNGLAASILLSIGAAGIITSGILLLAD